MDEYLLESLVCVLAVCSRERLEHQEVIDAQDVFHCRQIRGRLRVQREYFVHRHERNHVLDTSGNGLAGAMDVKRLLQPLSKARRESVQSGEGRWGKERLHARPF